MNHDWLIYALWKTKPRDFLLKRSTGNYDWLTNALWKTKPRRFIKKEHWTDNINNVNQLHVLIFSIQALSKQFLWKIKSLQN